MVKDTERVKIARNKLYLGLGTGFVNVILNVTCLRCLDVNPIGIINSWRWFVIKRIRS